MVVKFTVTHVLTDTAIDRIADAIVVMQEQEDTMTPVLKQQLQQCETEIRNHSRRKIVLLRRAFE